MKVKTGFQQGLIGPPGEPNRQFLPVRARTASPLEADRMTPIRLNRTKSHQIAPKKEF
jgi:hypothetical protein